eukprot:8420513-Pyramimonas_sp.AAC.1
MAVDPRMAELMRGAAKAGAEAHAREDVGEDAQRVNTNLLHFGVDVQRQGAGRGTGNAAITTRGVRAQGAVDVRADAGFTIASKSTA